jgi:hypothetical protein
MGYVMAIDNYPKPRLPISNAMWRYNAVGGETTLSGYDSFGQPLQYTVNSEQFFLNGVMLVRNVDYVASTGTTITGLTALSAGDFVEILTYSNFNVASLPAASITGKVVNSQLNASAITLGGATVNLGDTISSLTGLTIDGVNNVIHTNRGATTPATGQIAGDIFWDTTASALKLWNGSAWISFAPPGTPTAVSAADFASGRAYGNSAASISFTPATGGGLATQFLVTSTPGALTAYGTASPIVMTGLTTGTSYTFTVLAQGSFGNSIASSSTSPITVTSVPQAPTIGTATGGNTSASVAFTAGATGGQTITSYTVTSSPGNITGTGTTSPITVSGLSNGTAYSFTVTATNVNGTSLASGSSNSVTPAIPPAVSTNLLWSLDASQNSTSSTVWTDLSGNGVNVSLNNCTYTVSNSGGISFNGTTSYGTFNVPAGLTGDYTIEALIKFTGNNASDLDGDILALTNSSDTHGVLVEIGGSAASPNTNKLRYVHRNPYGSGTNDDYNSAAAFTAGNFYHIVIRHTNSTTSMWINGALSNSQATVSSAFGTGPTRGILGRLTQATSARYFYGTQYIQRAYSRALTDSEVLQNFNAVRGRVGL